MRFFGAGELQEALKAMPQTPGPGVVGVGLCLVALCKVRIAAIFVGTTEN
jgi:hypothetical protein